MNRPVFENLGKGRPPLVCSITDPTADTALCTIRNAIYDGADGFLIHLEHMLPEERTPDRLKTMFSYAQNKPILTLNYRKQGGPTDEKLVKVQYDAIDAGAGCVDMVGDTFGEAPFQLATDPNALQMQKEYIDEVHGKGAQVMMSSHMWEYLAPDKLMKQCLEMERRNADIIKIAMLISNEEEMLAQMRATYEISHTLKVPFLHILMGQYGKAHRVFGPTLGSCMILCVQQYTPRGHKEKPLLRAVRDIYNNLDYGRNR